MRIAREKYRIEQIIGDISVLSVNVFISNTFRRVARAGDVDLAAGDSGGVCLEFALVNAVDEVIFIFMEIVVGEEDFGRGRRVFEVDGQLARLVVVVLDREDALLVGEGNFVSGEDRRVVAGEDDLVLRFKRGFVDFIAADNVRAAALLIDECVDTGVAVEFVGRCLGTGIAAVEIRAAGTCIQLIRKGVADYTGIYILTGSGKADRLDRGVVIAFRIGFIGEAREVGCRRRRSLRQIDVDRRPRCHAGYLCTAALDCGSFRDESTESRVDRGHRVDGCALTVVLETGRQNMPVIDVFTIGTEGDVLARRIFDREAVLVVDIQDDVGTLLGYLGIGGNINCITVLDFRLCRFESNVIEIYSIRIRIVVLNDVFVAVARIMERGVSFGGRVAVECVGLCTAADINPDCAAIASRRCVNHVLRGCIALDFHIADRRTDERGVDLLDRAAVIRRIDYCVVRLSFVGEALHFSGRHIDITAFNVSACRVITGVVATGGYAFVVGSQADRTRHAACRVDCENLALLVDNHDRIRGGIALKRLDREAVIFVGG